MSRNKAKNKNSSVIMKADTTINWEKCEDKYIPAHNTIIVYQDDGGLPKIKISDGIHKLKDLLFVNSIVKDDNIPLVEGSTLKF